MADKENAGDAKQRKGDKADPKETDAKKQEEAIEAERGRLKEARDAIGLLRSPRTTISLFLQFLISFSLSTTAKVLRSPLMWLLAVPAAVGWGAAHVYRPELFAAPVCGTSEAGPLWWVEFAVLEAGWWIILGILSSVGFGTGLHSGVMFLFPHVLQVVTSAEVCHSTMGLNAWYNHPCKLDCSATVGPKDDSTVTFLRLWMLVTLQCMLWGFGTAIGELPPYLISKAARSTGRTDSEFEAELQEARSKTDAFSRMKVWTIGFTEKHGFLGVLALASWPNAAFDMCGMCCGYLLMDFWTFFVATSIGKGVIKVNLQAVVFVNLFGSGFFQVIVSGIDKLNGMLQEAVGKDLHLSDLIVGARTKLIRQFEYQSRFQPERLFRETPKLDMSSLVEMYSKQDNPQEIASRIMTALDKNADGVLTLSELQSEASWTDGKISLSSLDPGAGQSLLKMGWELFIVFLVCFFAVNVVNEMARQKQLERDEAAIEKLQKNSKKDK
mmetsp:Transcript_32511/g.74283  ORF Transcript_32511/g.74283 Transcript_32511/m.74283 type:complete len:497 (+) Transcript_32511:71-1561(+)